MDDGKLEPKAKQCIFLGLRLSVEDYRLWCYETNKFLTTREVTFDESPILYSRKELPLFDDAGDYGA